MSSCTRYAAFSPVVRIVKRLRRSLKQFPNVPSGPWLLALPDVLLKPFKRFPGVIFEHVPDKTSARQAKEILLARATLELGNCVKVHFIRVAFCILSDINPAVHRILSPLVRAVADDPFRT